MMHLTMAGWSLTFTILSFIVACLSLWAMIRIDKSTSTFAKKQAELEEIWRKENIENAKNQLFFLKKVLSNISNTSKEIAKEKTNEINQKEKIINNANNLIDDTY